MLRAQMTSGPQFSRTLESQWRSRHRAVMITPHRKPKVRHSGEARIDGGAGASRAPMPPPDPGWGQGREAGTEAGRLGQAWPS